jgi:hypothetical protein
LQCRDLLTKVPWKLASPSRQRSPIPRLEIDMRSARFALCVVALSLFAGSNTRVVQGADPVAADKRVPRETLIFLRVRSVPEFQKQLAGTSLGKLVADPALGEFAGQARAALTKVFADQVEAKLELGLDDLLKLPAGEIALAFVPGEGTGLQGVWFLQYGEERATVDKLIGKLVSTAEEKGGKVAVDTVEGVEVSTLTTAPPEKDPDSDAEETEESAPQPTRWFHKDGYLVLGNGTSWPAEILSRWEGDTGRALSDSRSYRNAMDGCRGERDGEPLISGWIDPLALVRTSLGGGEGLAPQMAIFLGFLPQLGIDRLRGVGLQFDLQEGDFESVYRVMVLIDQPPTKLMRLFTFPAAVREPAKWVPADATGYMSMGWDLAAAMQAVEETFDTFQGRGKFSEMLDKLAENPGFGGIHLKRDVVDLMAGKFQIAMHAGEKIATEGEDAAPSPERFLVAIALSDAAAFRKTFAKIGKLPSFSGDSREFEGETILELPGGGEGGGDEMDEASLKSAIAVVGSDLYFTNDVRLIEQRIRKGEAESPLVDSPEYRALVARFPAETSFISYQQTEEQLRALYNQLRGMSVEDLFPEQNIELDFTKLPEFDTLKKYFPPSGGYMRPHENGLFIESFSRKRDE